MSRGCTALLIALALLVSASTARAPGLAQTPPAPLLLEAALPGQIRVLLDEGSKSVHVGGKLQWLEGTTLLGRTEKATEVSRVGDKLRVRIDGKARDAKRLIAVPLEGYAVYDSRSFRGRFELFPGKASGLALLNVLPLEDYLCGVVPYEMPASWHPQALQAQAVAARSYALSRLPARRNESYDVVATVMDQVYRGVGGETDSTNAAVRATAGEVLIWEGRPITAMFCSDAGGCTLQGHQPYLQAVRSFNPDSKHNKWEFPLSVDSLLKLAKEDGRDPGKPDRIVTKNDPVSGHLLELQLVGSKGKWSISGPDLRRRLGYSTLKGTRALLYPASNPGQPPPLPLCDPSGIAQKCFAPGYGPETDFVSKDLNDATDIGLESAVAPARNTAVRSASTAALPTTQSVSAPVVSELKLAEAGGLVLVGSGYGHGHGMSQYGAAELARQGWGYREILLYFYRGVELVQLPASWGGSEGSDTQSRDSETSAPATDGAVDVDFYTPYNRK